MEGKTREEKRPRWDVWRLGGGFLSEEEELGDGLNKRDWGWGVAGRSPALGVGAYLLANSAVGGCGPLPSKNNP